MAFCCTQFLTTSDPECAVCQRNPTTRAVAMTSTGYGLSASRTRVASSTVETASSAEGLEATLVSTPPPAGKSYDVEAVPAKCGFNLYISTKPKYSVLISTGRRRRHTQLQIYLSSFHVLCLCQILVITVWGRNM